jgi:hypothetical protein
MATENRLRVQWYRQREHVGACNEEAADSSGIFFSGIRGT